MDVASKDLTTFTSHHGLYRFKCMPFGLQSAQGTFQRTINLLIDRKKWQYAIVYLDDIILFSNNAEERFNHLRTVLTKP